MACRYVPAKPLETHGQGIQTQVGGDWYDIIPLSAGRVGIVIGDVEGRGARAAAIMGQLRAALRAFAQDDKSPADIMRKLDDWCRTLAPATPRTAGRPGTRPRPAAPTWSTTPGPRTLSFANAGHDAPLLVSAAARCGELEIEHKGVLLGVRGKGIPGLPTYREETRQLPPGVHPGVLHRRPDRPAAPCRRLAVTTPRPRRSRCCSTRCARPPPAADVDAMATAAEYAVPGDIDDDMAIVVVRTSAVRPRLVASARSRPSRSWSPRRDGWPPRRSGPGAWTPSQAELACLLVSEVVTNVVLHASITPSPGRDLDLEIEPLMMPAPVGVPRPGQPLRSPPDGPRPGRPPCRRQNAAGPGALGRCAPGAPAAPREFRCGCGAARRRCGWRSSTPICGCPGSAARRRPTRGAAASTWWSSWPPGGDPGRPPERQGGLVRDAAQRRPALTRSARVRRDPWRLSGRYAMTT